MVWYVSSTSLSKSLALFYDCVCNCDSCVGPDRRIFLPDGLLDRSEIPEYLNGEVAGE